MTTLTEYGYNSALQGPWFGSGQYGNQTIVRNYGDPRTGVDDTTIVRCFSPQVNNDQWLVNKVALERVLSGIVPENEVTGSLCNPHYNQTHNNMLRESHYYYDGNRFYQDRPTLYGALTRTAAGKVNTPWQNGNDGILVTAEMSYDAYGNLVSNTVPHMGSTIVYNGGYQLQNGATTTIAYDNQYRLYPVSVTNPLGQITLFEIYGFNGVTVDGFQKQPGLLKKVTPPNGVVSIYEYDPFGRLWASYDSEASRGDITTRGDGDPVTRVRYWDNIWNYNNVTYLNPAGNAPFTITEEKRPGSFPAPANSSSGFAYNDQTFYDGFGRPIQTRSIWHWVEGQTKSREIYSSTAYDALGQVVCQNTPFDVAFYHDRATWPASSFITDACTSKPHTATTYDALGRPLTVTAPDGTATTYSYYIVNTVTVDGRNLMALTNIKDANNHITSHLSNSLGQLAMVQEIDGVGSGGDAYVAYADTRYYYDVAGNLVKVKQSNPSNPDPTTWLAQTTMAYDGFGRKTSMNDPDMGPWSYAYDAAGNLKEQVDANGKRLCFTYDVLNRMTHKRYDSNNNGCDGSDTQLAYYAYYGSGAGKVGQLSEIRWGSSSDQNRELFDYDNLGRMTSHTRVVDGRSYTMGYGNFDALHRPKTITYPNGEAVTMTYDREGENTLTAGADPLVTDIRYNARGQMTFLDRAGSIADTTYHYHPQMDVSGGGLGDSNFRLKTIQHGSNGYGDNKPDFNYRYDRAGQITQLFTMYNEGANLSSIQDFTYDHLNRLLTANATLAQYSHSYSYDKLGNIITFGAGSAYNYVNWSANCTAPRPTQSLPHAVKTIGGQYFCYDNNGNMTKRHDGVNTYTQNFDVENRLTSVVVNGQTTGFAYDASGLRVKTTKPNGVVIDHPFPNYEVENPTAATPLRRSTYSLAGQTIATRVSGDPVSGNNGLFYIYSDHLGSTSLVVNSGNNPVAGSRTWYLPFGGYRPNTAPTQTITDRDFTGQKENMELGLLYYNARFYVPGIGRFASADTIVPDPTNPQQYNRYSYVLNNALRYTDPSGHSCYNPTSGSPCVLSDGNGNSSSRPPSLSPAQLFTSPFFNFLGGLTLAEMQMAHQAASDIAQRMAQEMGGLSAQEAFLSVFGGPITLSNVDKYLVDAAGFSVYAIASQTEALITVGIREITNHYLFIHEIFHLLDIVVLGSAANQALWDVQRAPGSTFPNRPNLDDPSDEKWGFAGGNFSEWQKSRSGASGEEFADMGIGWTYNQWELSRTEVGWSPDGQARADFMNVNMAIWLTERIP